MENQSIKQAQVIWALDVVLLKYSFWSSDNKELHPYVVCIDVFPLLLCHSYLQRLKKVWRSSKCF